MSFLYNIIGIIVYSIFWEPYHLETCNGISVWVLYDFSTISMNSSSISTERFALFIFVISDLIDIKVSASLCLMSIEIIKAPLRLPPCIIDSVVLLYISMIGTIPSDSYLPAMSAPFGRILDRDTPCPPCAL